ncbi:MAG: nucleotidyltransferase family protein [Chloroflexi bacterium]|nr:nucleotidyltransferase family protein [Chloroflexota bacterium]
MGPTIAILLAAGESSRMGQLKALLPWQGSTLLEHQAAALLEAGADRVVVVLGHRATELEAILKGKDRVSSTVNPDYLQGKTTSLKAGLRAVEEFEPGVILILNVDQPRKPETIRQVLQHHLAGESLITIPTFNGKGGHPIAIAAELLPEVGSIEEESQGLKAVTRRHENSTARVELGTSEVLLDLNTPEDYEMALDGNT